MTTTTEQVDLSGVDLNDSVPCTVLSDDWVRPCGRPSIGRVETVCVAGHPEKDFICAKCLDDMKNNVLECCHCGADLKEWRFI